MPILPLYGHDGLRARLHSAIHRGALPGSVLLAGPRGIGKQRLALWLGQTVLCAGEEPRPCGRCQSCRYATRLTHPDLQWYFPRPRLKDVDAGADEVRSDYAEGTAERAKDNGLYAASSGSDGIFVATVRAIVREAAMAPALGRKRVFVIGDAERMVAQEGADAAANAFLKLLEEPLPNTTLVLTSSEAGALLPTVRSRVVIVRVPPVSESAVRAFLADPAVVERLGAPSPEDAEGLVHAVNGAPGRALSIDAWAVALGQAKRILEAITRDDRAMQMRVALAQKGFGARGSFSDTLDALTALLHERARRAAERNDPDAAVGAGRAVDAVERVKELASGNVNPTLLATSLIRQLQGFL